MEDLIKRRDAIKAEANRMYKVLHPMGCKKSYEDCLKNAVKTFKDIPSTEELIYEEMEKADIAAQAYAEGFKEGLESRKRGEWIHDRLEADDAKLPDLFLTLCQCSECSIYVQYESNFCPNCGAKMRKKTK